VTATEWDACADPERMLEFVKSRRAPDRRTFRLFRLFACGCVRGAWDLVADPRSRRAVEVAERYADGQATAAELSDAKQAAQPAGVMRLNLDAAFAAWCCTWDRASCTRARVHAFAALHQDGESTGEDYESAAQASLLRCIFGALFRPPPVVDPAWLAWNGGTVAKLAAAIYDGRRFADLPILADALEDAGCADAAVLAHCRGGGEHVRGCWAVDLLTGRQ